MRDFNIGDKVVVTVEAFGLPKGSEHTVTSISECGRYYRLDGLPGGYVASRLKRA